VLGRGGPVSPHERAMRRLEEIHAEGRINPLSAGPILLAELNLTKAEVRAALLAWGSRDEARRQS